MPIAYMSCLKILHGFAGRGNDRFYPLFIGAITEGRTNHTEIVHIHFWHDKENTIIGCYEAEPIAFDTVEECLAHPKIMEYARWALIECRRKGFI